MRRDRGRKMQVDHAGLNDGPKVGDVDLEDPRHPRERDDDASLHRDRATGEARPRAARDDGHRVLMAEPRECRDVSGALGEDDRVRRRGVDGAVVLVEEQIVVRAEHFRGTKESDQAAHKRRATESGANGRRGRQDAAPV